MTDTIKSVTNCPTCGSEVTVGGDGETHFYIPKQLFSLEDMRKCWMVSEESAIEGAIGDPKCMKDFDKWIEESLTKEQPKTKKT